MRPDPVGTGGLPPNLRPKNPDGGSPGKSNEPSEAEIANAKAAFEKTRLKGAEQLAAVVARIGEKQRRDPLVAVLRNGLARIEPFVSKQDFKKGLHAALDELASKGLEKGFVKLIELAIGKTAGEVKRPDTSVPPTGTQPDEAPGEHIVTKDVPLGDAKGNERFVFDGARAKVAPGQSMIFKVWTPARWSLKNKRWDNTRVIVEAKGGAKGSALPSAPFRKNGANEVKLTAPDVPGEYLLYIEAAGIRETSPEYDFEVSAGQGAPTAAAHALSARSERKADADDDKTTVVALTTKTPGAAVTKHLDLTIDNQSDRTLRLVEAGNDGGRFDPAPPAEIAPKKKSAFAAVDTGAKGGTLVYELQVAEGPVVSPDQLVSWKMSWSPPAKAGQPQQPDSTLDPELKGFSPSAAGGKGSVAFVLAGTSAAATQPASSASPAAGQRRIDITFINQSDQHLKYWGADKMKVTFEQRPPDTLQPGASASFAIVAKGTDEIAFGLMYSIVAKADAKADASTPMWTPHFTIPAGTTVMVAGSDVVPDIVGLKSSENAGTDAISFVLSGKTVASAQQPGAGAELRIPITFTNDSNMVLRFFGADKMALAYEGKPPKVIKPGQSFAFAVRGKRDGDIHFGLMYSILASETETGDNDTPKWRPYFDLPQGGAMIARCDLDRGTDGLGAAGRSDKGGAIFSLSGKWTKENQELKTQISIENTTRYKLRLVQSSAAPGRFEPAPPAEIAPGTTVVCASWAKVESVQKAVYELEAAEGAAGAEQGSGKPRRWTIGWHTKPQGFPVPDSQVENIELRVGDWQIYDIDLVRFKLDIKSDAKRK